VERVDVSERVNVMSYYNDLEADKHASTIVECASNIITTPYPEMTAVVAHHFLSIAILCLCLILMALIFLIFEQYSAECH
jgi:hypothetical protein